MYITITPQQTEGNYSQSAGDYVAYLEKENERAEAMEQEHFFNQYEDEISGAEVTKEIDGNTAKLSKKEPKFYAITISPSKAELKALTNPGADLKDYVRQVMVTYVESFNREIKGRKVTIDDIKYFAKMEHKRYFKGTDREVRQNQKIAGKILELQHELRAANKNGMEKQCKQLSKQIDDLEALAPNKLDGQRIKNGMEKPGLQTHIHIIVSRKDASNSVSLSPGSKYKASDVEFQGKMVKRGFDRDRFFERAEQLFDKKFDFDRSFVERYGSRKLLKTNRTMYFKAILGLPQNERALAIKMLAKSGARVPHIPITGAQLALKAIRTMKKGLNVAVRSSSIGV
ncbi:MobB family relaxase [Maribacter sp. 2307ULW6-5]|uniref:MobB family relaxase n=1 Tax=Maribacter sp. 2307ULW6-5 TaxID=3386275 RepID=UPI0039BC9353